MTPQSERLCNIVGTIADIDLHPASAEAAREVRMLEEELLSVAAEVARLEAENKRLRAVADEVLVVPVFKYPQLDAAYGAFEEWRDANPSTPPQPPRTVKR